jgi:hypothetical protein
MFLMFTKQAIINYSSIGTHFLLQAQQNPLLARQHNKGDDS